MSEPTENAVTQGRCGRRSALEADRLFVLNNLPWYFRLPVKWLVLGVTLLAVCFPYPGVLVRHLRHWQDPNALIEPDAAALQPLVRELEPRLAGVSPRDALGTVETFVYERIPYEWDWNTWGTADYLPTVTEAIEKGKEDCDGRAVVAASLLNHFGVEAAIVTDFAHVWVKTEYGEMMGPGEKKAVIAEDGGLNVQPGAILQLPRALAYGIGPFPILRELIVVLAAWLLLLRRHGGTVCNLVSLALLVGGLLLLRGVAQGHFYPAAWAQTLGIMSMVTGIALMLVWARANARRRGTPKAPVRGIV